MAIRMICGLLLAATAACSSPQRGVAAENDRDDEMVQIHSDMCFHEETGDVVGYRLILVQRPGDDYVVLERAEGALLPPLIGRASVEGATLRFVLAEGRREVTFNGAIRPQEVTGSFDAGWTDRLGRRVMHWTRLQNRKAPLPTCS